jgi:hypothetical protein
MTRQHSPTILTKEKTRLRVRQSTLPVSSTILGKGIDVMGLPEGHLCCGKCGSHLFECWMYGDVRRVEMGCMGCGESTRLYFPMDVKLDDVAGSDPRFCKNDSLGQGRFQCLRHPTKGMILVHNVDVVSIGCESCFTEINICLRKAKGMVLADG